MTIWMWRLLILGALLAGWEWLTAVRAVSPSPSTCTS